MTRRPLIFILSSSQFKANLNSILNYPIFYHPRTFCILLRTTSQTFSSSSCIFIKFCLPFYLSSIPFKLTGRMEIIRQGVYLTKTVKRQSINYLDNTLQDQLYSFHATHRQFSWIWIRKQRFYCIKHSSLIPRIAEIHNQTNYESLYKIARREDHRFK